MPKIHTDRLKSKYGKHLSDKNYARLMDEVITNGHESIQNAVARVKVDELNRVAAKVKRSQNKTLVIPNLEEVLPKRSVFIRKAQEQRQIMSDTLRDQLTKDLRSSVAEFLQTGEGSMQYKQGARRGQINPKLVADFRKKITATFDGYTKPDATGVPSNINVIAETEVRSAIDDIKHTFNERLQERNQGKIRIMKRWVHHPSFSNEPRSNHREMNGVTVPMDVPFMVPRMKWIRGQGMRNIGVTPMKHPHDPDAPIDQSATCHCEVNYITQVI